MLPLCRLRTVEDQYGAGFTESITCYHLDWLIGCMNYSLQVVNLNDLGVQMLNQVSQWSR
jgi:hypothetical protein